VNVAFLLRSGTSNGMPTLVNRETCVTSNLRLLESSGAAFFCV
jgi:hypothetical protein